MYVAKPHTIKGAFKLTKEAGLPEFIRTFEFPEWYKEAEKIGKVQLTCNLNEFYIAIYNNHKDVERCYEDEYLCINDHDKIYKISEEEFNEAYTKAA